MNEVGLDEIRQLKKELEETLKCLEHENLACASTTKGKQRLEDKALGIKRALWGKVRDLEWFLEKERVCDCVTECKELGIIVEPKPVECPICLEAIPNGKMATMTCCGKLLCIPCSDVMDEKRLEARRKGDEAEKRQFSVCPCCRATIPETEEQCMKLCIKRAEKGCSWSQYNLGHTYEKGRGVNVDLHKAAYWFRRSAEQGHTFSQYTMGRFHGRGLGGCEQSEAVAEKFYALAAAKNDSCAQRNLAGLMHRNDRYTDALQWYTLSAAQGDCTDGIAEYVLASMYDDEDAEGIAKSRARALYWAKKAAMAGDKDAFCLVAYIIMQEEVGSDYEALFWLRQGILRGAELADEMKTRVESDLRSFCSGCSEPARSFPGELKKCNRCLAAYYCSKKCQVDHWTRGHKLFCCDKKGKPRFSVFPDCDWNDISQMSL